MNTYTIYLTNGLWGSPVVTCDRYTIKETDHGMRAVFYRDEEVVAEFISVMGVVKQDVLVPQGFEAAFNG